MVASSVRGGGLGARAWWVNATVPMEYHHPDPEAHVGEIAARVGVDVGAPGVGMLTAVDVTRWFESSVEGVYAVATVGLGWPVWAAESLVAVPLAGEAQRVGTVNILVVVPVPLADAALVNAVVTVSEAKTQALVEAGVPGTGTASDAVCVACPASAPGPSAGVPAEPYGGPRSLWGARVARAVHAAVSRGTAWWIREHPGAW